MSLRLWTKIEEATKRATDSGALCRLPTECFSFEEAGIEFSIRVLGNLRAKTESREEKPLGFDPFLPYDPDLFVADLGATHVCLLNKFNVVDHHILMVTRAFEEQETPLNESDFEALYLCLSEVDGLGFYNSGDLAGASQRHKHLQLAPLPEIPVESAIRDADPSQGELPQFPFRHRWRNLRFTSYRELVETYAALLDEASLDPGSPQPYNLLATRRWMMLVPRKQEKWNGISINALGFAGSLLVKNEAEKNAVKRNGPIQYLKGVTDPVERD